MPVLSQALIAAVHESAIGPKRTSQPGFLQRNLRHRSVCAVTNLFVEIVTNRNVNERSVETPMGSKLMANDEVVELIERVKAAQAEYEGKYQQLVKVWQRQTEMINHLIAAFRIAQHPQPPEWRHEARRLLGTDEQ